MKSLKDILRRQSFQPGIAAVFFHPFFLIRYPLFKAIRQNAPALKGKLMDFGCGSKPYQNLFKVDSYIGVDVEQSGHNHQNSKIDVFYNGTTLPFESETFDSVFSSEVLEHLFQPDAMLHEINRVLKPGGKLLLTAPFGWNEHEMPYDYARYTSEGICSLLRQNGFEIIRFQKTGNFVRVLFQLWILYLYEVSRKGGKAVLFAAMLLIVPLNLLAIVLAPLFPVNRSLYFNNVVLAQKKLTTAA
jgi:SAM-dependent methyltransferase